MPEPTYKLHPTEIPEKILPANKEDGIEVPVEAPDLDSAVKDVESLAKDMKMEWVGENIIRRLRAAGVALDQIGLMKMTRGGLFLTQQGLLHVNSQMIAAINRAESDELKAKLAMVVGYLSEKFMRVGKEIREGSDVMDGVKAQQSKFKSFAPGQVVQNNYYLNKENPNIPKKV